MITAKVTCAAGVRLWHDQVIRRSRKWDSILITITALLPLRYKSIRTGLTRVQPDILGTALVDWFNARADPGPKQFFTDGMCVHVATKLCTVPSDDSENNCLLFWC